MPASPETQAGQAGKSKLSRVRVGLSVGMLFLLFAVLGGWFWVALVAFSIYQICKELRGIMAGAGFRPSEVIVQSTAVLMVLVAALNKPHFLPPLLTIAVIAGFFRLIFRSPRAGIGDIGSTLISILYGVYFPVHFILLRQLGPPQTDVATYLHAPGFHYMLLTLVIISASDVGAYYIGKKFGKNLLSPEISPKKTREGALGGLAMGILFGVLVALGVGFPWKHAVILGVLLVVVGQMGDLAESLMKRDSGMKDSGAMLAGHGGFLDRADSYIFSGAVSYYYIYWVVYQQGLAQEIIHWFRQLG